MPPEDIPAAFDQLKDAIPTEASQVIQWFENTYVHGRIRRRLRNGNIVRSAPLFPPHFWSVVDNIEYTFPRTQNSIEAWHRQWETLVGAAHTSVFKIIRKMQKGQFQIQLDIEANIRGARRRRQAVTREARIQTVYNNRDQMPLMNFLRGIAHNLSL